MKTLLVILVVLSLVVARKLKYETDAVDTCVDPVSNFACPTLSNPKTGSGQPFYYFDTEACGPSITSTSQRKKNFCLDVKTSCRICYIPEIVNAKGLAKPKGGLKMCPDCVYKHWKLDHDYAGKDEL
eukprot:TRINITY_DN11182_c0_g1_i1.p1 TRINITY_DN11182_c0_g1~~TRINITY_DN11182_c0_g1_i1.p1  ORF type:complete len:141 (+),score=30.01 TRINITY_DN11182_c0_g1_i1:44-424(+)